MNKINSTRSHLKSFNIDTAVSEIEDCFKRFIKRDDIDIILINQNYAELIRHVIDAHTSPIPAVLEIPSKGESTYNLCFALIQNFKINLPSRSSIRSIKRFNPSKS